MNQIILPYQLPSRENEKPLKIKYSLDHQYLDWDVFFNSLKKARGFTYTFRSIMNNEKTKNLINLVKPFKTFPENNHLWIHINDFSNCIIRWCEEDYIMFLNGSLDNTPGVIYIVGDKKGNLKCGRSRNMKFRLMGYKRTDPDKELLFLSEVDNIVAEEKEIKRIIKDFLNVYNEEFEECREYFHTEHTEELINEYIPNYYINSLE